MDSVQNCSINTLTLTLTTTIAGKSLVVVMLFAMHFTFMTALHAPSTLIDHE